MPEAGLDDVIVLYEVSEDILDVQEPLLELKQRWRLVTHVCRCLHTLDLLCMQF